jgi:hypothetical protein
VKEDGRHGNAFFMLGGEQPETWIECRYYYGGRKSLGVAGDLVEPAETREEFERASVMELTVEFDLTAGQLSVRTGGQTLTSKITGILDAITHIGYGGSNFANSFTPAELE